MPLGVLTEHLPPLHPFNEPLRGPAEHPSSYRVQPRAWEPHHHSEGPREPPPDGLPLPACGPLASIAPSLRLSPPVRMAPHNDVEAFHEVLRKSCRVLALCGAGLSASSGLPTFRGAGGYWRSHDATKLATMQAFRTDPGMVWLFYGYRRHACLRAAPNPAHRALAALAKGNRDFMCLTQNVDGECCARRG